MYSPEILTESLYRFLKMLKIEVLFTINMILGDKMSLKISGLKCLKCFCKKQVYSL